MYSKILFYSKKIKHSTLKQALLEAEKTAATERTEREKYEA